MACTDEARVTSLEGCLELQHVAELGRLGDSISITSNLVDVARLAGIGWVVIDPHGLKDILLYRADGTFAGVLLRRGEGPQEVASPSRLATDATDSLWISDGNRRLAIVKDSGTIARMLTPFAGRVQGFTRANQPFEILVKGVELDTAVGYARFWTRSGDSLAVLGPGIDARWNGRSVGTGSKTSYAPSTTIVWSGTHGKPDLYVEEWSPRGSRPLITAEAVWATATREPIPEQSYSVAITATSDTTFLGLARVRGGEGRPLGIIYAATGGGTVTGSRLLDDAPFGFVDSEHFFTITDTDTGLKTIRVVRVESNCTSR